MKKLSLILFLILIVNLLDTKAKEKKEIEFSPEVIYTRPDGSQYAKLKNIGWVTVVKSTENPNPFLDKRTAKTSLNYDDNGNTIIEIKDPTQLLRGAKVQNNLQINTENIFPENLKNVKVFPNPTNGNSVLQFNLSEMKEVKINLYDIEGNLIKELANQEFQQGLNEYKIPSSQVSSGTYIIAIIIDGKQRREFVSITK